VVVEYTNPEKKHKPYSEWGRKSFDGLIIVLYFMVGNKPYRAYEMSSLSVIFYGFNVSTSVDSLSLSGLYFRYSKKTLNKCRFLSFTALNAPGPLFFSPLP
jgi:hypothetical protein